MWEEYIQFILIILLDIILVLIGIIPIFLYRQTKKRGFILIGIGFLLEATYNFIPAHVPNILINTFGMNEREAFSTLIMLNSAVSLILVIPILIGVIMLRNEFKSRPTS